MAVSIDIAVMCSMYQKRLCWMMSSVLQQKGNLPRLVFSVAYPENEGSITTEAVCSLFRSKGLDVREQKYPLPEDVNKRGLTRNRQLAETDCEWMLFADCDMVYDEYFFEDLGSQLAGRLATKKDHCMTASRMSLDIEFSKKYFNEEDKLQYPCVVENAVGIASKWPVWQISLPSGAGYFQLANVDYVRTSLGGVFVKEDDCGDWSWKEKWSRMRSDRQFRLRMDGRIMPVITKPQYHLNHERDKDTKHHITVQR